MILYLMIALFATLIGSLVGMGGGVIIKPLLQTLNALDPLSINVLSSITVFFMALTTLYKRSISGERIYKKKYIYLILGSFIGGILGNLMFSKLLLLLNSNNLILFFQTIILILLMILILFKNLYIDKLKVFNGNLSILSIGVCLSIISTFLGIGGGPINVPIFICLLGVNIFEATYLSILIIFFSQLSNIMLYFFNGTIANVTLIPLITMIPAAILGGMIGAILSRKINERILNKLFNITIIVLIILNIYNLNLYL